MHALVLRPKRCWSLNNPGNYAAMGMVLPVDTECPDRDAITGRPMRVLIGPTFRVATDPGETWLLNKEEEDKYLLTLVGNRLHTGTLLGGDVRQEVDFFEKVLGIMNKHDVEMLDLLRHEGPTVELVKKCAYEESFLFKEYQCKNNTKGLGKFGVYSGELFASLKYGGTLHSSLFKLICPTFLKETFFPGTTKNITDDVEINSEDY